MIVFAFTGFVGNPDKIDDQISNLKNAIVLSTANCFVVVLNNLLSIGKLSNFFKLRG